MEMAMKRKSFWNTIGISVLWILILGPCIIRILDTLYAFPYQDDFYYTAYINEKMGESFLPFSSAVSISLDKYFTYRGYFFSCFLYYFFDAILQCNIWGIRLFLFATTTLFYVSLFGFVRELSLRVLKIRKNYLILILFFIFSCFNMTFYYPSNEIFYWMCSAEVTTIPMIMILVAGTFFIKAIDSGKKLLLIVPIIFGLLIGGATVNVAAFGCVVYGAIMLWGIISKRKTLWSLLSMISIAISGSINVFAPSNISSSGITEASGSIFSALVDSLKYVLVRMGEAYSKYPLVIFLTIALSLILLKVLKNDYVWKFRMPGIFMGILFISQVIVIFPVILAYDYECARIEDRTMIVSDLLMYFCIFLAVFYWVGWIKSRWPKLGTEWNSRKLGGWLAGILLAILVLSPILIHNNNSTIVKVKKWLLGYDSFIADWNENVINTVASSPDEIVRMEVERPYEESELPDSQMHFGEYDPETEYTGNSAMAWFFGKKAIYLYLKEE